MCIRDRGRNVNITDVYIHGDKVYFGLYEMCIRDSYYSGEDGN